MAKFKSCISLRNINMYKQNFTFLSDESRMLSNACPQNADSIHEAIMFIVNTDSDEMRMHENTTLQDLQVFKYVEAICDENTQGHNEIIRYTYSQAAYDFFTKPLENILHFMLRPRPLDHWFSIVNSIATMEIRDMYTLAPTCEADSMYVQRFLDALHDTSLPVDSALVQSGCARDVNKIIVHAFRIYDPHPAAELRITTAKYHQSFLNSYTSKEDTCIVFSATTHTIVGRIEDTIMPQSCTYTQYKKLQAYAYATYARTKIHKCAKYMYGRHLHTMRAVHSESRSCRPIELKIAPQINSTTNSTYDNVLTFIDNMHNALPWPLWLCMLNAFIFIVLPAMYMANIVRKNRRARRYIRKMQNEIRAARAQHIEESDRDNTTSYVQARINKRKRTKTNLRSVRASPYFPA